MCIIKMNIQLMLLLYQEVLILVKKRKQFLNIDMSERYSLNNNSNIFRVDLLNMMIRNLEIV